MWAGVSVVSDAEAHWRHYVELVLCHHAGLAADRADNPPLRLRCLYVREPYTSRSSVNPDDRPCPIPVVRDTFSGYTRPRVERGRAQTGYADGSRVTLGYHADLRSVPAVLLDDLRTAGRRSTRADGLRTQGQR